MDFRFVKLNFRGVYIGYIYVDFVYSNSCANIN